MFILNSRCANVDGLCTFQHGLAGLTKNQYNTDLTNACMLTYDIEFSILENKDTDTPKEIPSWERQNIWGMLHIDDRPCGACALFEFKEIGISAVKIVGRQNTKEKKIKDTTFIKELLDFLDTNPDKKTFREYARKTYHKYFKYPCLIFKCYYPSVLIDGKS